MSQKQVVRLDDNWFLSVTGLVEKSLNMDMVSLRGLPTVEQLLVTVCAGSSGSHPLIKQNKWTGVLLESVLGATRVKAEATHAQFMCGDGYATALPVTVLSNALLAYGVDGNELPPQNGYPIRLIVPGLYAHNMPKWIQHIEFTNTPMPSYLETQGWTASGQVRTISHIFTPHHMQTIQGTVKLAGVAYAGLRSITRIEVSVDDSEWTPVTFRQGLSGSWTEWQAEWRPPAAGDYSVRVRATDSDGFTQSELSSTSAYPHGSNAIHSIVVRVSSSEVAQL